MGNQITKIDNILLSKEMMDKMKNARSEADEAYGIACFVKV